MMVGAAIVRVPAPGWAPAGYVAPAQPKPLVTTQHVYVYDALRTPQFWLIWWILCLNVTAGIGVLGPGLGDEPGDVPRADHRGRRFGFCRAVQPVQHGRPVLLVVDLRLHRPQEHLFCVFSRSALVLYALVPYAGSIGSVGLFVLCYAIIFSMYGGGFATVPAYLRDMFGTRYVGAIHGLLLTAWSMAGIFGPVLVNYIRQYNVTHGVPGRRPTISRCM